MSSIGWIDFSSTDRERVSQVLARLREPGTLDELGIGQIRDAFADILFPGFSTIQTRAKYFVTVPQMFADYWAQDPKVRVKKKLEDYLKESENTLAETLSENHAHSNPFPTGIIGHTLIDKGGAANRPSSSYWTGLRKFGLVNTRLSLAEYCRFSRETTLTRLMESDDPSENDDMIRQRRSVATVPGMNPGWREDIHIELTRPEAEFLRDKIRMSDSIRDSIPAQLMKADLLNNEAITGAARFSVLSELLQAHTGTLSTRCLDISRRAQRFSDAIEGAHIRFNRVIANKLKQNNRIKSLDYDFTQWRVRTAALEVFHKEAISEWTVLNGDMPLRLGVNTRRFLQDWNEAMLTGELDSRLDALVVRQAIANKGNRSLLKRSLPADIGWSGIRVLDYRWPVVRQVIGDIKEGLSC